MAINKTKASSFLIRGGFVILFGTFVGKLSEYLLRIIIARQIGATALGTFTVSNSFLRIGIAICVFGLSQASTRYISFFLARREEENVSATIGFSLLVPLVASAFFAAGACVLSGVIASYFYHNEEIGRFLATYIWALPFFAGTQIVSAILRSFKAVASKVLSDDILKNCLILSILVALNAFENPGIANVAIAHIIALPAAFLISLFFLNRYFALRKICFRPAIGKRLFLYSIPMFSSIILAEVRTQTDIMILGKYVSLQEIGYYSVAMLLGQTLLFVIESFNFLLLPDLTEKVALNELQSLKEHYKKISNLIFSIVWPAYGSLVIFSDFFIVKLFSPEYVGAAVVTRIFATALLFIVMLGPAGIVVLSLGRTKAYFFSELGAFLCGLAACLSFIPKLGVIGAAIGGSSALIFWQLLAFGFARQLVGIQPVTLKTLKLTALQIILVLPFAYYAKAFLAPSSWANLLALFLYLSVSLPVSLYFGGGGRVLLNSVFKKS